MNSFLSLIIGIFLGIYIGWVYAHAVVAAECRRLGGFFVGKTVFKCVEESKHE